jgi:GGDEF domain-containing protein
MFFRRREVPPEEPHKGKGSDREALLFEGLSGLYQAWYFQRRAEEEVARCARYGRPFVLIIWEALLLPGEVLSEEVVAKAGEVIRGGIRKTDLAGQLDRTSFAALLIEATYEIARSVAYRLKGDLGQRARTGSGRWRSGFAVFPDDGLEFDALLQVAVRRLNEDVSAAA